VDELQQLARSLLIFGMQRPVAVPDRTTMIDLNEHGALFSTALCSRFRRVPLSGLGRDTGLKFLSHHGVPAISAHRHPGLLQLLERVRRLRHAC